METSPEPRGDNEPRAAPLVKVGNMGKAAWACPLVLCCAALLSACQPAKITGNVTSAETPKPDVIPNQPQAERGWKQRLLAEYARLKKLYTAAPNNVVQYQLEQQWERYYCAAMPSGGNFTNWTGRLAQLTQDGTTVNLTISLGDGFSLANAYGSTIEVDSPAYKLMSNLRADDLVTVTGQLATDTSSNCNMNERHLSDNHFAEPIIYAQFETLNGKPTHIPPPVSDAYTNAVITDSDSDARNATVTDNATDNSM